MFPIWPGNTSESHQEGQENSTGKRDVDFQDALPADTSVSVVCAHSNTPI